MTSLAKVTGWGKEYGSVWGNEIGSVWMAWLCWIATISGDDDFWDMGRGDWQRGISTGDGAYLGEMGVRSVGE